jgi:hypothetical protein
MIIEELEDEILWDKAFANSQDSLAQLAAEAMAEHRAGKTEELSLLPTHRLEKQQVF